MPLENSGACNVRFLTSWRVDAQLVTEAPLLALVAVHTRAVVGRQREAGRACARAACRGRHALVLAFQSGAGCRCCGTMNIVLHTTRQSRKVDNPKKSHK